MYYKFLNMNFNEKDLQKLLICLESHCRLWSESSSTASAAVGGSHTDSQTNFQCLVKVLRNHCIQPLICFYEKMSKFDRHSAVDTKPSHSNASHLMTQIYQSLKDEWISECQDLCQIIANPHLRAILFAADCVARSDYSQAFSSDDNDSGDETANDSDGYEPTQALKLVRVVKNDEPLGATVKVDEKSGAVVLARVLVGGAAHRSGLINVGDQILEVNGVSVRGRSPIDVITLLERNCKEGVICFKLLATDMIGSEKSVIENAVTVRAHFDYDPSADPHIPCDQIGLSFKKGNILNVVNREDPNWWQASKLPDPSEKCWMTFAGLIPGQQLQERRLAILRDLKSQYDRNRYIEIIPGCKSPFRKDVWAPRKVKKVMYDVTQSVRFDREALATYEPVAKCYPRPNHYRPIVLIGPVGVGRKTLTRLLLDERPNHFRRPIAHTTRFKRFNENDGIDYHFVSDDWMHDEIKCGNFLEFGQFKGNSYGIHKESVHQIINSGYVCLLNLSSQGLKRVYTAEFKPYVVFVRPPYDLKRLVSIRTQICDKNQSNKALDDYYHHMIFSAHKLNYLYAKYFDVQLIVDELRSTYVNLIQIIHSLETEPKWVPIGWAHSSSTS